MIDGIYCRVHGESLENIQHSQNLQFKDYPNRSEAKFKGLIITVYNDSMACYLRGSIHSFKNEGRHNADLFTYNNFIESLNKLESELGVYASDLQIIRFEIGVNISLSYPPWQCVNTISEIQNRLPTKIRNGLFLKYSQYTIKVYSKSEQYKEFKNLNILRIEIAYSKKQKLTGDMGSLSTLDDLLDQTVWVKASEVLMALIGRFSFLDYSQMNNKDLSVEEKLIFYEWSNATRISQEPNRSKVSRMRKRVKEIYQKYSENSKINELKERMKNTLEKSLSFKATTAMVLPII